jgi:hypothetical protein
LKKSEWSDKQLEDQLRQLPRVIDNRNPRDIYQNVLYKLEIKKENKCTDSRNRGI